MQRDFPAQTHKHAHSAVIWDFDNYESNGRAIYCRVIDLRNNQRHRQRADTFFQPKTHTDSVIQCWISAAWFMSYIKSQIWESLSTEFNALIVQGLLMPVSRVSECVPVCFMCVRVLAFPPNLTFQPLPCKTICPIKAEHQRVFNLLKLC